MTRVYKPDYLETAIYDVIDYLTTETIAYANQQQSELTPPYVTLSVDSRMRQGADALVRVRESDGAYIYHGDRTGGITLLVVGDGSGERAEDIVNALQRDSASAAFRKYGPVLYGAQPIDLGFIVVDNQVEPAYAIDVRFRTKVIHFEAGGWIETVALGWAYGLDPAGSDDTRGAMVVSKPGTTPPADHVLIVVIDPPNGELKAGTDTAHLPFAHVQPFANIQTFSTETSDPTIAEIIRPPAPAKDFLRFHKAGTVDYTVTVHDKAGREVSDTITLQIV